MAAGVLDDAAKEAGCPGEDEGVGEAVANCEAGGVKEDDAAELVEVDVVVIAEEDCRGLAVVMETCVASSEAVVGTRLHASEELDPMGEVNPAGHGLQG